MSRNKDICKTIVELCIGRKVRDIRYLSGQEPEKLSPSGKGIRMDVYLEDAVGSLAVDAQWRYDYMLYEINLSESREAGLAEGREEGHREGRLEGRREGERKTMLEAVRKISKNMSLPYERAMDVLDLADSERIWLRAELSAAENRTDDVI